MPFLFLGWWLFQNHSVFTHFGSTKVKERKKERDQSSYNLHSLSNAQCLERSFVNNRHHCNERLALPLLRKVNMKTWTSLSLLQVNRDNALSYLPHIKILQHDNLQILKVEVLFVITVHTEGRVVSRSGQLLSCWIPTSGCWQHDLHGLRSTCLDHHSGLVSQSP